MVKLDDFTEGSERAFQCKNAWYEEKRNGRSKQWIRMTSSPENLKIQLIFAVVGSVGPLTLCAYLFHSICHIVV